jgi:DNA polymerase III delta subunit
MPASRSPKRDSAARTDGASRVILLTGADTDRKTAAGHALLTRHVDPDFFDFDAETLDGATASAEQVLSAVATVPLGNGQKVVYLRDTHQIDPEAQKRLADGLGRIPASGLLVLGTGAPVVEEGKVRRGSVVVAELTAAVKKLGEIQDFPAARTDDLRAVLLAASKEMGKTLDPDALSALAQLPPDDAGRVRTELEKAALHAGTATRITLTDVEATLSRSPDDVIFKLCDAVGGRRTAEALGYLQSLFQTGARPESVAPRTLVMLARQIRLLAQFRYLGEKRLIARGSKGLPADVAALLPGDGAASILANPRTAWMADKYLGQARNFAGGELAERLERLLHADLALKGAVPGGDDPRALMQRLVIELC